MATKEYSKAYYQANKDKILARSRQRHLNNREVILDQMKTRYKNPKDFRVIMLDRARQRAKSRGLEFSISIEDFEIPEYCPVFKYKLERNFEGKASYNSPSLDRIDSSLGYVPGNVQVISYQANVMKNNASKQDLLAFADWILDIYDK